MSAVVHRLPLVRPALGPPRRGLPGIALDGEPRAPGGSRSAVNGSRPGYALARGRRYRSHVEGSTIEAALARADDLTAASDAAVTLLAAGGRLRATAYLARAGSLRSLASAGSSHVLDGVPVANGPVGRALRFGDEQLEVMRPGVSSGVICVPLNAGGRVAGVLAVTADGGLTRATRHAARTAAAVLGRRIDELGGPPEEGPASRLAQHAAALAGLEDPARIERATLVAALDLAEMESAVLLRGEEKDRSSHAALPGRWRTRCWRCRSTSLRASRRLSRTAPRARRSRTPDRRPRRCRRRSPRCALPGRPP